MLYWESANKLVLANGQDRVGNDITGRFVWDEPSGSFLAEPGATAAPAHSADVAIPIEWIHAAEVVC